MAGEILSRRSSPEKTGEVLPDGDTSTDLPSPTEVLHDERHTSAADVLNALIPRTSGKIEIFSLSRNDPITINPVHVSVRAFPDGVVMLSNDLKLVRPGEERYKTEITDVNAIGGGQIVSFSVSGPRAKNGDR